MVGKVVCYYHEDMDGICSAAIVKSIYPEAKLVPVQYDRKIEFEFEEEICIIVDFSFPKEDMELLRKSCLTFCWIDHHKSAMEKLPELWNRDDIDGLRSVKKSGCELTWEWFYPHQEPSHIVKYIGDWDTWTFKYGDNTKKIFEYLNLKVNTPDDLLKFILHDTGIALGGYLDKGELLLEAKEKRVQQAFAYGQECEMWVNPEQTSFMKNCFICNSNVDISDLGNYIAKQGYDVGIVWSVKDGKLIVGLRSIGDIDVSQLAKNWGGGGHKNASGFTLNNIMDYKKLLKQVD